MKQPRDPMEFHTTVAEIWKCPKYAFPQQFIGVLCFFFGLFVDLLRNWTLGSNQIALTLQYMNISTLVDHNIVQNFLSTILPYQQ